MPERIRFDVAVVLDKNRLADQFLPKESASLAPVCLDT